MTKKQLLQLLEKEAREYRQEAFLRVKRNRHMNDLSSADFAKLSKNQGLIQRIIDTTLVDFINFVGAGQGIDYGLYVKHIKPEPANRT